MKLRRVTAADCGLLFEWANDPVTRANSATTDAISLETHERWFTAKLTNPDVFMYVAEDDEEPVGLVLFDVAGEEAEISVNLAPEARGKGVGSVIIRHGCAEMVAQSGVTVVANIRQENVASQKAFRAAGFKPDGRRIVRGVEMLRYARHKAV